MLSSPLTGQRKYQTRHYDDFLTTIKKKWLNAFKTFGVHTRKNHTRATWRQLEDDWKTADAVPPPLLRRSARYGSESYPKSSKLRLY